MRHRSIAQRCTMHHNLASWLANRLAYSRWHAFDAPTMTSSKTILINSPTSHLRGYLEAVTFTPCHPVRTCEE